MHKKILMLLLFFSLIFTLAACVDTVVCDEGFELNEKEVCTKIEEPLVISLEMNTEAITIVEGSTFTLAPTTNDVLGVTYNLSEEGIITVSDEGVIEAVSEGTMTVTVTSKTDESKTVSVDVTVTKLITLTSDVESLVLTENDTHQLVLSSNDEYTIESSNTDIIVVSDTGLITAKTMGTANIIVTSTYDDTKVLTIPVEVLKLVELDITTDHYELIVEETIAIALTTNDELTYQSYNPDIATIDENGLITAVGFGLATIKVISDYDPSIFEEVTVQVYKYTEAIEIIGSDMIISGMVNAYAIKSNPVGAFAGVTWESNNTDIITIDEFGNVTGVTTGIGTITAKSTLDETIVDTFTIEVINISVVDTSKTEGDVYSYNGLNLAYGERLFGSIQEAIDQSPAGTVIYLEAGTYTSPININKQGLHLVGLTGAIISTNITISSSDILIDSVEFTGNASIHNANVISNFMFSNNNVHDITVTDVAFINFTTVSDITVTNNIFDTLVFDVLSFTDMSDGHLLISENMITNAQKGISIRETVDYNNTLDIKLMWNELSFLTTSFDIDLSGATGEQAITAYARFNKVTEYEMGAVANAESTFDFTLNHWGSDALLDMNSFINVSEYYLQGYYVDCTQMPGALGYNVALPITFIFLNPIEEIMIGETHSFEYLVLPLEMQDASTRFITVNPDILAINQEGVITPQTSGTAKIQIRSRMSSSIKKEITIRVITTPGIELLPSHLYNDLAVGDTMTLNSLVFPYTHESEAVIIESSDPSIASIDASGLVTTHAEGTVTFTASLVSDETVNVSYTITVWPTLDENNLLDYLTMKQIQYSTIHEWTAYGFQYNYSDKRYESVSRYYFDNIVINDTKMVPVFNGIRPGEPMDPLPEGITGFNDDDIYWVVIHDTASAATGSNALAHANYLYNSAINGVQLWVSWHYTIDDHDIYQHLPENERGYHAGDGSTNPGEGSYTGGGNRNGVGIEMSINDDGDMMRTWQRTAKLVVDILTRNNMPITQYKYHNDFSGKDCPNTLRNAGLIPLFEEFVDTEYKVKTEHPGASIIFTSNNPDYLDDHGRIHTMPERAMTVSYTITVIENGITQSRTFYTYLPGTVR